MTGALGDDSSGPSRRLFLQTLTTTITASSGLGFLPSTSIAAEEIRGRVVPAQITQYADAATDLPVSRLTDPAYSSALPSNAVLSSRGDFLLFVSELSGTSQVYRMDFKKENKKGQKQILAEVRQWTDLPGLKPTSVTLLPGERFFLYADDLLLYKAGFSATAPLAVYRFGQGWEAGQGITITSDGTYAALVEKTEGSKKMPVRHRLRLLNLRSNTSVVLTDTEEEVSYPLVRPKRASVLYRRAGDYYLANFDGQQNYRLKLAEGEVRGATWNPDGRSILYLSIPPDPKKLIGIREFTPDTNQDRSIADTSQYAGFGCNGDASVFVGASGGKASPYVLLLVRAVKRELALCEHRASDPALVAPIFAPDSQHIYFNSDLHGKPAIYRMDVGKLVAETLVEEKKGPADRTR